MYALAVDGGTQNFGTRIGDGFFHAVAGVRFDEEDHATATSRATDFAG